MQLLCYYNGLFLPQNQVSISTTNIGFTRGYAAFELFRTYDKEPFYLTEHLERLKKSAKTLHLFYPNNLEEIIFTLLEKNDVKDMVVRIYLSEDESEKPNLLILCDQIQPPTPNEYENGIKVITTPLNRQFHEIKTTNYLSAIVALKEAAKKGACDALFVNQEGYLLEFTKSNFFCVINGVLRTAKEEILLGITREIILKLARDLSIDVAEGGIHILEIPQIEEAFSSSTIRELLPISQINEHKLNLGPITKKLHTFFKKESVQFYHAH